MTFTETPFVSLLLLVAVAWYLCRRNARARLAVLLAGSLVFYAHDRWPLLALLLAYIAVDWAAGLWITRARRPRLALLTGVAFNLGVLAVAKYTPLAWHTLALAIPALEPGAMESAAGWEVPHGLSFYAFTGVAYLVDVYRRRTAPEARLARFALFLSFFPHLVAGPILRAREFLPALQPGRLPASPAAPGEAAFLLGRGYFKKMVLADRIAATVDPFFAHVGSDATAGVWALPYVYLYAVQIYFDFSGYTDIARGLALWFGFRWPDNFRLPYLAASVREFWQRWHITLSLFLRDYLYVPLGGSRRGEWRTSINLMLTFLLGGLWHGGTWSFLLWGGLHGALVCGHRLWSRSALRARVLALSDRRARRVGHAASVVLTFHCVCAGWCFFRLTELRQSVACLRQCMVFAADRSFTGAAFDPSLWLLLSAYTAAWLMARRWVNPLASDGTGRLAAAHPFGRGFTWGVALSLLLFAVLLAPSNERPQFIYFQF